MKAEIAAGDFKGDHVFIPHIPLESSCKLQYPIHFKRMQIPVRLCFAMTINKAQGQTLDVVGIYLSQTVFSHGQLYVALSRARRAASVKILIHPNLEKDQPHECTRNVVYHEIFNLSAGILTLNFDSFIIVLYLTILIPHDRFFMIDNTCVHFVHIELFFFFLHVVIFVHIVSIVLVVY